MTFTYDPAALATSLRDRIRFDLQDVDATDPVLQDEELDGLLSIGLGKRAIVLALAARAMMAKYATDALTSVGSLGFAVQARVDAWEKLACFWEKRAAALGMAGLANTVDAPLFTVGLMDNPQVAVFPSAGAPGDAHQDVWGIDPHP